MRITQKSREISWHEACCSLFTDGKDDKNYVEPDISVICDKSKLTDKGCNGAPDWIIEVVSPGSQRMDCMIKLFKYRSVGVREYWIVDPKDRGITVYSFENDDMGKYSFSDSIPVGIWEDCHINFPEFEI